ncbi:unnamed protein product [Cylindrotheca closterium]|uniref:Ion transport domain-containing protein n=1 Tax=Cylindrotheca closterium TaxID=2856 RepID=A0AAD2CR02_9STRA|nr:unnamed protein product [Cylindrotheca closterium]
MSSRPPTPPGRPRTPTKPLTPPPPSSLAVQPPPPQLQKDVPTSTEQQQQQQQQPLENTDTKPQSTTMASNQQILPSSPSDKGSLGEPSSASDITMTNIMTTKPPSTTTTSKPAAPAVATSSNLPPATPVSPPTTIPNNNNNRNNQHFGTCDTCGIPTHRNRGMLGLWKKDVFTNEQVYQGTCIRCHGELVPPNVFLEWYLQKRRTSSRNKNDPKSSSISGGGPSPQDDALPTTTTTTTNFNTPAPSGLTTISNPTPGMPNNIPGTLMFQQTPSPSSATTPGGWSSIQVSASSGESTRVYEQGFQRPKKKMAKNSPNNKGTSQRFSFAGIENADSPTEQKALRAKYDRVFQLLQSCRTDLYRPTTDELDRLRLTEEDWRSIVLISNIDVGCRLLHWALVFKAPYPTIRFLLQRDVESSWTVQHADTLGSLPLHYACRYGAPLEVFELLLREDQGDEKKTIIHVDKQGWMPLHVACQFNCNTNIIKLLLDQDPQQKEKRSVTHRDNQQYLPIHLALERNVPTKTLELLLTADTQRKTIHGPSPSGFTTIADFAMKYDYQSLLSENSTKLLNFVVDEMNIHTACRFGVPLETIKLLLDMDSNQSIYKIDEDENLPLHCALDGTAALDVIRHLIRMDTSKSTLHQKNKDGSTPLLKIALREDAMAILSGFPSLIQEAEAISIVEEMNLAVKMKVDVSLELQMKHTKLVNTIWQRRDFENRPSIAELTSLGYSEEFWRRVVLIEDEDTGWLPLHWALAFGAPPSTIGFLLEKDYEQHSIRHGNLSGSLPIHFACLHGAPYDIIQGLLDKDVTRSTIHEKNNAGKRPLDLLPRNSDIIANLVKDARTMDMQPETLDFFFQSAPPSLLKRAIMDTLESGTGGTSPLEWMNYGFCQDSAMISIMLEFYLLITWIAAFVYASVCYLLDGYLPESLGIMLPILTVLVLTVKFRCAYNSDDFDSFFSNIKNVWNFCAIALVFASAIALNSATPKHDWRPLIIATGTFQIGTLLISLKRTFYSLSTLLGAVYQSFWKLVPFFFITGIVIVAFAFFFFVNRYNTDLDIDLEHQTLVGSLTFVFHIIVGRPDETLDWLDATFSILTILVLLNVAIAIVTQNWQVSTSRASNQFWVDRLDAIIEYRSRGTPSPNPANRLWEHVTASFHDGRQHESLFDKSRFCILYLDFFLVGLATCGYLWPQEIRRDLFYAPLNLGSTDGNQEMDLVAMLERKIQLLEENMEWNQRLMDRKMHEEFDDLKSLLVGLQDNSAKKPSKLSGSGNSARVDMSGKPQPFPPTEILVAKA